MGRSSSRAMGHRRHRRRLLMLQPSSLLIILLLVVVAPIVRGESKCLCQTSGCLCCVELNLTASIDLGGPACVNVRQQERNVSLNLSYGDNPVHNATIALADAARKPTCMNLLSDLAQICAKFGSMKPAASTNQGDQQQQAYEGCLVIEPALLGTPQATYPVGCFTFDRGQVRQLETPTTSSEEEHKPEAEQEQEDEDEDESGLNAEELIAAVSASAEQGIAFFSQWLGLNLAPRLNITAATAAAASSSRTEPSSSDHRRPPNNPTSSRHSRTMSLLMDSEDQKEERFKQLLSAQDNILKESETIGEPSRGLETAFFYSQPDAEELRMPALETLATISPENLAVVPSESRRGGRAYNIHQHVNEV